MGESQGAWPQMEACFEGFDGEEVAADVGAGAGVPGVRGLCGCVLEAGLMDSGDEVILDTRRVQIAWRKYRQQKKIVVMAARMRMD